MAAQPTTTTTPSGPPPALGPNSSFQEDIDHWKHRLTHLSKDTKSLELEGTESWSASFFGCFNPIDLCFITCCLPCVTFGKTHHRLHKDKNLAGYSAVNASCLGFWASTYCCLSCIPLLLQRSELRKRASPHLTGDTATDALKAICCGCCDLIQQEKEAEHLLAAESLGYVSQQPPAAKEGMSYPSTAPVAAAPVTDVSGAPVQGEKVGL